MRTSHFGQNVFVISDMPWSGYYGDNHAPFEKYLKTHSYKYFAAITTANSEQQKARKILKENGFKTVVTFESDHGDGETLTLWLKIDKKARDQSKKRKGGYSRFNCSVSSQRDSYKNCIITTKTKSETLPEEFKQVKNTPLYFKLQNGSLVRNHKK